MVAKSVFTVLKDVILLTEAVKNLNASTEKLADKVEGIDKRLVRIETMAEMSMGQANIARNTIEDKS
jgi:SMC interacting uncharacterized protein involved in chromosome segregation